MDQARLLVVDDNRDWLEIFKEQLEDLNCLVYLCDTVVEAIKKVRRESFDVAVLDLKMTGRKPSEMGGLEIMREIVINSPATQIIIITGYGTQELARSAFKGGVFDFINKEDINFKDIRNVIKRAILESRTKVQEINPFSPKTGVEPKVFGGRFKELRFFEKKLKEADNSVCDHFLILGDWGIGKTMLMREFKMLAQKKGHIASIVTLDEFGKGTTLLDGVEFIIQGLVRDVPFTISKLDALSKQLSGLGITVMGTGFQYNRDISQMKLQPQTLLFDTLLNLSKDISKTQSKLMVVILDDIDYFEPISEILTTIKQVLSHEHIIKKTKILFAMTCTPEKWTGFISLKKHHPIGRYFLSKLNILPLSKEELTYTIEKTLEGTGVAFSKNVIEKVFFHTEGHPFEMQLLCRNLYDIQRAGKVDLSLWDKALQNTLVDLGAAIFDHWFKEASKGEAQVLKGFSARETSLSIKEVTQILTSSRSNISSGNIGKYIQRLVEKKLLRKVDRGNYEIADKMFRAYVNLLK